MSAINPASFASQPLGLQAPSGIGPGAVGVGRGAPSTERRQAQQTDHAPAAAPPQQPTQPVQQPLNQQPTFPPAGSRGYPGGLSPQPPANGITPMPNYPSPFTYSPYATFQNIPRVSGMAYGQGMMPAGAEGYAMGYTMPGDYHAMRARFPVGQPDVGPSGQGLSPLAPSGDWAGSFQSLSLTR